ncbi:hypothetical protein BDV93DRAFT_609005 [Ceratobasidium sp. AG-I]|nr:hypothetical protein BDV93DRAFT_609005 [Ceratobasidium sp. AG-I]
MFMGVNPKHIYPISLVLSLLCQLAFSQQSTILTIDDNYVYSTTGPDGIQYFGDWTLLTGSNAPSRTNNTLHSSVRPQSQFVYFFRGTLSLSRYVISFEVRYLFRGDAIYYYADRDVPHGPVSVTIDGGPAETVNSTATSIEYQQLLWSKTGLGEGDHQIVISHIGTQGQYIGLDYLQYVYKAPNARLFLNKPPQRIESSHGFIPQSAGPAASSVSSGAVIVDDTDPSLSYSSNWTNVDIPSPWSAYFKNTLYCYTLHATRHPGSTVTFKFNGTAVWYFSDFDVPHGYVRISVDGAPGDMQRPDSSGQLTQRLIWSQENLDDKEHTVVITHADSDGKYATLDFFMYLPSMSSSVPTDSDTPKKHVPSVAIAGGAAGGTVLLIIAAVLIFLFFKRQHRKHKTPGNLDLFDDMQPTHHGQPTHAEIHSSFQAMPFAHTSSPDQSYQPYHPSNTPGAGYFERSPVVSEGTTPQMQRKVGMGYLTPTTVPPGASTYTSASSSGTSSSRSRDDAPPAYM